MNVGVREQAQSLKALQVSDGLGESGDRGGIENVAALHRGGHLQMMFDERPNFCLFLGRKP